MQYTVHYGISIGKNTKFWRAAGLDHLFYLTKDESGQALLDRAADRGTLRYVRNHHTFTTRTLLSLPVGGEVYHEDAAGNPRYDFSKINSIFAEYVKRGIKPIVEYDYVPDGLLGERGLKAQDEGYSTHNCGPSDWEKWQDLLYAFTVNLKETFGLAEIQTWYFEVWNEPDGWPLDDIDTFYKMYDVFASTVKSVDSSLRVGGPGCFREHFLKGFLEHVANGKNHVTGEVGSPIDFISYHMYGMSSGWVESYPLIVPTVQRFLQEHLWVQRVINKYPRLQSVPFHLNEWGVCSKYQMTKAECETLSFLRDTEFSALFFIKLIACLYTLRETYDFCPALMLYWGFSMESYNGRLFNGERSLTTAGDLPKPILTAMELMEKTGKNVLLTDGVRNGGPVGALSTGGDGTIELLAYYFDEQAPYEGEEKTVTFRIEGLTGTVLRFSKYTMDRQNNAFREWERQGSPAEPEKADMQALFAVAEPMPAQIAVPIKDGCAEVKITLFPSSFALLCGEITD